MEGWITEIGPLGALDLGLAQRAIERPRGQDPWMAHQVRRNRWIQALMGARGWCLSQQDVEAVLQGKPGRFLPQHREFGLIRNLNLLLDLVEERAERKVLPTGPSLLLDYRRLVKGLPDRILGLRKGRAWDLPHGFEAPRPVLLPRLLARFREGNAYLAPYSDFKGKHPVLQGAALCRQFLRLSPFESENAVLALLATGQFLMAHGYPPFLPLRSDRPTLMSLALEDAKVFEDWFTEVLFLTQSFSFGLLD
ncbi:MAG TPA: hypothetical protein ENK02_02150 [Planctomycetes bacterium]|nr:hypothetical protein [Planctomycetota bacterium]